MDIGFGPGNLRRDSSLGVEESQPYVIAGHDLGNIGIQQINSTTFDYENVREELTFHWFKHNIMCRDNPWICGDSTSQKSSKKGKKQSKAKKLGGGKKKRRKNGKDGASTSKTEFRRRQLKFYRSRKRLVKQNHLNKYHY